MEHTKSPEAHFGSAALRIVLYMLLFVALVYLYSLSVPAADNAEFLSQSVPPEMGANQSYTVSVSFKNTGGTTWNSGGSFCLTSQNLKGISMWRIDRVCLSNDEAVPPGANKTFYFTLIAPGKPGNYFFLWRMQKGQESFGDYALNQTVNINSEKVLTAYLESPHHAFRGVGWNLKTPDVEQITALDDSTPQFLRLIWTIESYQPEESLNTYESDDMQRMYAFLRHAKEQNTSIFLTNWNSGGLYDNFDSCKPGYCQYAWPDHYFWLPEIARKDPENTENRFCHKEYANPGICSQEDKEWRLGVSGVESDHPYNDMVFANTLADNLEYMVYTKNCSIDYLSIWNEPQGDWFYHPRDADKTYPSSFTGLYRAIYQRLSEKDLLSRVKIAGLDISYGASGPAKPYVDYALENWDNYFGAYSLHNYDGATGANGEVKYLFDRSEGKPIIIGEVGHFGVDGCQHGGFDRWGSSIETTRLMLSDIRYGAYAVARWWFTGGYPETDCWLAMNGSQIIPENYNSLRILSNTLPQTGKDVSVVNTDFPDFGTDFEAAVINSAPAGQTPKPVVWAVNKGGSQRYINIKFTGLQEPRNVISRYMKGVPPYEIVNGLNYSITPQNPVISLAIPDNSIFIAEAF
jgi:hypothetical protein